MAVSRLPVIWPPPPTAAVAAVGQGFDLVYLAELDAVDQVSATDATFWCDDLSCDEGVALKRVTAAQIGTWTLGQLAAVAPIVNLQNTISLAYDSTLSLVDGRLHVAATGGIPEPPSGPEIYGRSSGSWFPVAPITSPALTGTPTAPTAAPTDSSQQLATTAWVGTQGYWRGIVPIAGGGTNASTAPQALTNLGAAPIIAPSFLIAAFAPTPGPDANDTQIATTAFVVNAIGEGGGGIVVPNAPLLSGDGSALGSVALGGNLSLAGAFPNQTLNVAGFLPTAGGIVYGEIISSVTPSNLDALTTNRILVDQISGISAALQNYVPLAGGVVMTGSLQVPAGTPPAPSLAIGFPNRGLFASGTGVGVTLNGLPVWSWVPATASAFTPLEMNAFKITGLGAPTTGTDAATRAYVDSVAAGGGLPTTGGTMTGPINFASGLSPAAGIYMGAQMSPIFTQSGGGIAGPAIAFGEAGCGFERPGTLGSPTSDLHLRFGGNAIMSFNATTLINTLDMYMSTKGIHSLAEPVVATDAATKNYVDTRPGGGTGTVGSGTGPQIAQYGVGTSTAVSGVPVSRDATIAQGGALTVIGLQGRQVLNITPTDTQVLAWSASNNSWMPTTGGGGGGITGITAGFGVTVTPDPVSPAVALTTGTGGGLAIAFGGTNGTTQATARTGLGLGLIAIEGVPLQSQRGGTQRTNITLHALMAGGGPGLAVQELLTGPVTTVLHGGLPPSYGAVNLAADVAGTLPVTRGGTGITTLGPASVFGGLNILTGDGAGPVQPTSTLFWDDPTATSYTKLSTNIAVPSIYLTRSREGAPGVPSAVLNEDPLGFLGFSGYGGTPGDWGAASAAVTAAVTEDWTGPGRGTLLGLLTTARGSNTLVPAMRLHEGVWLGDSGLVDMGRGSLNATAVYVNGGTVGGGYPVSWLAGINPNNAVVLVAQRAMTITAIFGVIRVVNGAPGSVNVTNSVGTQVNQQSLDTTVLGFLDMRVQLTTLAPNDYLVLQTVGNITQAVGNITVYVA